MRAQFEIWRHNARFRVCRTGRRFGKTTEAAFELLRAAQLDFRQEVGYLAPSLKDAKRLMWLPLKRMVPRDAVSKINETTLTIELKHFESRIRLFGADRPESIYGEGLDFLAIDEAQSMTKDVWETYASPTLVDRQGHCIIYYRPEGFNWVYDLFLFAEDPANAPDWAAFGFTTLDGENVRPEEIERERRTKSDLSFRQEYLGLHVAGIARVYSEFDRDHSVTNEARDLGGPIWVGMDFNANPFCAVFASKTDDDRLLIWDELGIYEGTTQRVADEIQRRFPDRQINVCPDPSGNQISTASGGRTNFWILGNAGFEVHAARRTPPVSARINTTQAMLCNAAGERRLLINHRCRGLIRSLEGLCYSESAAGGEAKPDKKHGFDHFPDAMSYLVFSQFPLVKRQLGVVPLYGT